MFTRKDIDCHLRLVLAIFLYDAPVQPVRHAKKLKKIALLTDVLRPSYHVSRVDLHPHHASSAEVDSARIWHCDLRVTFTESLTGSSRGLRVGSRS